MANIRKSYKGAFNQIATKVQQLAKDNFLAKQFNKVVSGKPAPASPLQKKAEILAFSSQQDMRQINTTNAGPDGRLVPNPYPSPLPPRPSKTPTPTPSITPSNTVTPTITPTPTKSVTPTRTPTPTPTRSA